MEKKNWILYVNKTVDIRVSRTGQLNPVWCSVPVLFGWGGPWDTVIRQKSVDRPFSTHSFHDDTNTCNCHKIIVFGLCFQLLFHQNSFNISSTSTALSFNYTRLPNPNLINSSLSSSLRDVHVDIPFTQCTDTNVTPVCMLREHKLTSILYTLTVPGLEWRHTRICVPVTLTLHSRMPLCKYQAASLKRHASSGSVLFESRQDIRYPDWRFSWFAQSFEADAGTLGRYISASSLQSRPDYVVYISQISESVFEFLKLYFRKLYFFYCEDEQIPRTIAS